jgi:hypothetical protein
MAALAAPASAQKVAAVDISFQIADWRYPVVLEPREIADVCSKAQLKLAEVCAREFKHLDIKAGNTGTADFQLAVVLDTDLRESAPGARKAGARLWYFELTRPNPATPLHGTKTIEKDQLPYQSFEEAFNPIPNKDVLIRQIESFIEPDPSTVPAGQAQDLGEVLQERVFSKLPLFPERISHVAATPLVTVPDARAAFGDLPARSLFRVSLEREGLGELDFKARLLEQDELIRLWGRQVPTGSEKIFAQIYECAPSARAIGAGCKEDSVKGLEVGPPCRVRSPLFLIGFMPARPGEVDPGRFDPSGGP